MFRDCADQPTYVAVRFNNNTRKIRRLSFSDKYIINFAYHNDNLFFLLHCTMTIGSAYKQRVYLEWRHEGSDEIVGVKPAWLTGRLHGVEHELQPE